MESVSSKKPPRRGTMFPGMSSGQKNRELEISFFIVFVLSGVYIAYELLSEPAGGHPFGHSLGILGTLLMLMTEVLYSLRKRTRLLNWAGPVRVWLSFHIFTGIVGPFMVLMHTGLAFRGLAGISMLLTVIVVGSGFIGRYLYTALPRSMAGAASSRREIIQEAQVIQKELIEFREQKSAKINQVVDQFSRRTARRNPVLTVFGRSFYQWQFRRRLRKTISQLEGMEKSQQQQLERLLARYRELSRQIEMMETAREMLRYWHILHIPFGLTLFFSVAIHITATLFFRTGLFQ